MTRRIFSIRNPLVAALIAALIAGVAACRKPAPEGEPPKAAAPTRGLDARRQALLDFAISKGDPPEKIRRYAEFLEQDMYSEAQSELDRKDMIRPAPPGFKGKPELPHVQPRLFLEKGTVRAGEKIRFRVELQNISDKEISLLEMPSSFFKTCALIFMSQMRFVAERPGAKPAPLLAPTPFGHGDIREINFPVVMTDAEKRAELEKMAKTGVARGQLFARLAPGESLLTRGDRPGSDFCDLVASPPLEEPGSYRLRFEYDDTGSLVSQEDAKSYRESGFTGAQIDRMRRRALESLKGNVVSEWLSLEVRP